MNDPRCQEKLAGMQCVLSAGHAEGHSLTDPMTQNLEKYNTWAERRRQELQIENDRLRIALAEIAMGRTHEDVKKGAGLCADTFTAGRLCQIARDALRSTSAA